MPDNHRSTSYATLPENALYEGAYQLAYYSHLHQNEITAGDRFVVRTFQLLQATAEAAEANSRQHAVSDAQVERIMSRALFDALLKLSSEGHLPRFHERYLILGRGDRPHEYATAVGNGDIPADPPFACNYVGITLADNGILLHCYFAKALDSQEATFVVQAMAKQGQLSPAS